MFFVQRAAPSGSRCCSHCFCCSTSALHKGLSGHLNAHTAQLSLGAFSCFSHMSLFSSPRSQLMFHLLQGDTQNTSVVMSPAFVPRTVLNFLAGIQIHPIVVSQAFSFPPVPQWSRSFLLSPILCSVAPWPDSSWLTLSVPTRRLWRYRSLL